MSTKHVSIPAPILQNLIQAYGMGKDDEVARALQAIIENRPSGESSLDQKLVDANSSPWEFTEASFRIPVYYEGQKLVRHPNGGGYVPAEQDEKNLSMPFVAETVHVAPLAMVTGQARLYGKVFVMHRSHVSGAARLSDNAMLQGNAHVSGDVKLRDFAALFGNVAVYGNGVLYGYARLSGDVGLKLFRGEKLDAEGLLRRLGIEPSASV